jgi:cytochrome P460
MIMQSLKLARRSHRMFAALIASSCFIAAAGCSSDDDGDAPAETDEDVSDLQPGQQPDAEPLPPPVATVAPTPTVVPGGPGANGLELPTDFLDWRVIGVAMPNGATPSIRVIVGNDIAVNAARRGITNPWPDGSMMGHMVWTQGTNPDAAGTVVPGNFGAITLMKKDVDAYAADGGWAYGRWAGANLTPLAAGDDRACVDCHTSERQQYDYVFTDPGALPSPNTVNAAAPAPNGLKVPTEVLDWRVIGVAQPGGLETGTIRVIVGNDTAVDAARAGETNPWPENSAISHFVWALPAGSDTADVVVPGDFAALTFMVRSEVAFAEDGDWAFSIWTGRNLAAPEAAGFDRVCVDCHASSVPDNDRVFTRPGTLPEL